MGIAFGVIAGYPSEGSSFQMFLGRMYVTQLVGAGHIPSRPGVTFLKPIGIFPHGPYWQMRFSGTVDVTHVDLAENLDTKNTQLEGAVREIRIPREMRKKGITQCDIGKSKSYVAVWIEYRKVALLPEPLIFVNYAVCYVF